MHFITGLYVHTFTPKANLGYPSQFMNVFGRLEETTGLKGNLTQIVTLV